MRNTPSGNRPPSGASDIRDTLFGDAPLDQWVGDESSGEPWTLFARAKAALDAGNQGGAVSALRSVLAAQDLEPRHYAQAWHFLAGLGVHPPASRARELLGVVIEAALDDGLDLLACYPDHSARYYNFSGAAIVWEHPDDSLNGEIDALLAAATDVLARIGPWEGERPPAPPAGQVRINMLTPSGLHFGQGPFQALASDALGGPVLQAGLALMKALIKKTGK